MVQLTVNVRLKSDALIGSGEGFGAVVDSDIVFDRYGLPFIPAKRFKGCLRHSATEVVEMFEKAGVDYADLVAETFGEGGQEGSTDIFFTDLTIPEYDENSAWLDYLLSEFGVMSSAAVTSAFTYLRQSTRIDEKKGIAEDHSLRTIRVIKKGYVFAGEITLSNTDLLDTLTIACHNLRRLGTKRNRGLGEVEISLYKGKKKLDITERLKTL